MLIFSSPSLSSFSDINSCQKHAKAMRRLLDETFGETYDVPRPLLEQRNRLLSNVLSVHDAQNKRRSWLPFTGSDTTDKGDATSDFFWFSTTPSFHVDDGEGDAREHHRISHPDRHADPHARTKDLPALPRQGSMRLETVVESDEEDENGAI